MSTIARTAGVSGSSGGGDKSGTGGIDAQINSLQQRKSELQGRIAAKEAYAQQCYNAQAGPGQLGHLNGEIDNAKKQTGQIMANWALGPGAGSPSEGVDAMKAEVANIDEQISNLQQQKQSQNQNQENGNATDGNNNNGTNGDGSKINTLENQVAGLNMEKDSAHAQNNYPKEKQLQDEINKLNVQIAAMRGGNNMAVAA